MTTPNPKRVAAGKLNRAKRKPLSNEARARLRIAIIAGRPWEKSTGPRTAEGLAKSSRNAIKAIRNADSPSLELSIERQALQLLKGLKEVRNSLHIDPKTIKLQTGASTAERLRSLLFAPTRAKNDSLAAQLKNEVLDGS